MAQETIDGKSQQGWFIPYRHAGDVKDKPHYPAIAHLFKQNEDQFAITLDEINSHISTLASFNGKVVADYSGPQPRWNQDWFPGLDGASAFCFAARENNHSVKNIIEVGSGHSTRFLAAGAARCQNAVNITCIDPAPRAALTGLDVTWIEALLCHSHHELFSNLKAGDIAFFDSSHLLMPGTDVDIILNEILPALKPGVLVHFHDILLPNAYPEIWQWRGYNEQNGLAPWLLSKAFRPLFSSHYARNNLSKKSLLPELPLLNSAIESSLWLIKN